MSVAVAARKPSLLYKPLGIALAILAIVILWMLIPGNPATLALLAIAILFLFGLKRPLWAVAAILVSQLTVTSYMVSTPFGLISLRLLLLVLTLLVLGRAFAQRQIDLGPKARKLLIPILLLISVSVVANLVNSGFDFAFRDFRNMIVGLLIVIFIPAVTRSSKDLKILCGVVFAAVTASALIGLMQHYQLLGMDQATLRLGLLAEGEIRVPGMAETELELAYVLAAAILVVLSIYLAKGVNSGHKRLVFLSMLLMVPTLYFTYTRSALFALGLGLVTLLLFLKVRIRGEIILALLLLVVGFIEITGILSEQYLGGRAEDIQEKSSVSRQIAWQAGINIAMDNPILGIGGDQFTVVSPRYATSVDPSLLEWEEGEYWSYRTLGSTAPHNDYLNVWLSYGTLALVFYLWLVLAVLRNFLDSGHTTRDLFTKGLSIGMAAALVAYVINAFYHNLMTTLPLLWILAGFSLAITKLALKRNGNTRISQVDAGNPNP